MEPLVSIIMPVFNAVRYIGPAIESVIQQTYQNWELLIVDDGSTDGSKDVIARFSEPRIRYFFQPNKGVSSARNIGLRHRRGQFLVFLDADDALSPNSVSSRLRVFAAHPHVNMVDGHVEVWNADMKKCIRQWTPSAKGYVLPLFFQLKPGCFICLTWMIRVLPDFPFEFDEEMRHAEDLLFLAQIANTGDYEYVSETIYLYRSTPGSAMKQIDGLAKGYWQYYRKISVIYGPQISIATRFILQLKLRKIMFLTYLAHREIVKAVQYMLIGRTHSVK